MIKTLRKNKNEGNALEKEHLTTTTKTFSYHCIEWRKTVFPSKSEIKSRMSLCSTSAESSSQY
jgi:hypothetical protein